MDEAQGTVEPQDAGDDSAMLIDCGQASQVTRGMPLLAAFELGWPPNNRMYVG